MIYGIYFEEGVLFQIKKSTFKLVAFLSVKIELPSYTRKILIWTCLSVTSIALSPGIEDNVP